MDDSLGILPDDGPRRSRWRFLTSLRTMMTTVFVVGCGLALLVFLAPREPPGARALRAQCANNLKQIAMALHNYAADYQALPPAFVADATGKPMHSWRVLILPYLEQQALYAQYNLSEPWDGPNNIQLLDKVPSYFE